MPQIVLDRSTCPADKAKLEKQKTVTYPDMQYDVYQCPVCRVKFALNWHPLGEPDGLIAAEAAQASLLL